MASVRAGVPMVMVPTTWDKPEHARRMVDAGVAVRLPPRRCTPHDLRAAVDHVLADSRYRENASRYAALLDAAPGPAGAAELLEALAAGERGRLDAPVLAGSRERERV
jgi:UDP:flavonoid glycosyltransferase YjiC (YdhE family)